MPSKGAMRAVKAIIQAAYNGKDRLGQPMIEQEYEAGANIIDRYTTADKESIIIALANSTDLNLTERQINVMRSIVDSAGKE